MLDSRVAALHTACRTGDLRSVRRLVDEGVPVYQENPTTGEQALHIACRFGHKQILELLRAGYNMDVNIVNKVSMLRANGLTFVC